MSLLGLRSNIASLLAQRQLGDVTSRLGKVTERLSSGLRINTASDDPAGLAVSLGLTNQSALLQQAVRNVNDGVSLLNLAEAATGELTSIATRIKELAVQAANGSFTLEQRRASNSEANALVDEFNRIINSVEFNDRSLLDTTLGNLTIQAGIDSSGGISFELTEQLARLVGDGTYSSSGTVSSGSGTVTGLVTEDFNSDGILDIANLSTGGLLSVRLGNGDGTFGASVTFGINANSGSLAVGDLDGDGNLDIVMGESGGLGAGDLLVFMGNGNGTFEAAVTYSAGDSPGSVSVGDFNQDGVLDVAVANAGLSASTGNAALYLGNGDGTLQAAISIDVGAYSPVDITSADLNDDGILDIVVANDQGSAINVALGNGDGTFQASLSLSAGGSPDAPVLADVNEDGILDIISSSNTLQAFQVFIGNGDGTFEAAQNFSTGTGVIEVDLADVNGDGHLDALATDAIGNQIFVHLGNGDGTFANSSVTASGDVTTVVADLDGDGVLDLLTGQSTTALEILLGNTTEVTTLPSLNINTEDGARDAIQVAEDALDRIVLERATIGALQSRFSSTVDQLQQLNIDYQTAASRIRDADIAEETAKLVRYSVQQQAAAAILAQANQQPSLVLQLLSGSS